jgi:hypothetical protein
VIIIIFKILHVLYTSIHIYGLYRSGIEVVLLNDETIDPLESFHLSEKVKKFKELADGKNVRVKYMSFVSQKKGGPAKKFSSKTK